jgi:hypothetical protein
MYKIILEDIKAEFPGVKMLDLIQVAKMFDNTRGALYKLMERKTLSLKFKKDGGKYLVSIYTLAKYLAETDEAEEQPLQPSAKVKAPKASQPVVVKGVVRHRPPASKRLFHCFMANIQQLQEEAIFYGELYRELEAIEFDRLARKAGNLPNREHRSPGDR